MNPLLSPHHPWPNNPMLMQQQQQQQHLGGINRSMHDLHLQQVSAGYPTQQQQHHQGRPESPGSQRSRGSRHANSRFGKQQQQQQLGLNKQGGGRSASNSRPHSRSNAGKGSRAGVARGRQHQEDLYYTDTESEDEDFFTGESEMDFVSLSSGSNPRRHHHPGGGGGSSGHLGGGQRKTSSHHHQKQPYSQHPWVCQHCTYVNTGGSNVCVMCCKTSSAAAAAADNQRVSEDGVVSILESPLPAATQFKVNIRMQLYLVQSTLDIVSTR